MSRSERLRRVLICLCHFTQNLAFFRAGWENKQLIRNDEFWRRLNGNCRDIAIVEWCKLFTEKRGKHCWRNIITEQAKFSAELYSIVGGEDYFNNYVGIVKTYRDKFVAHLDDELEAHLPNMDDALKVSRLYYRYVAKEVIQLHALGGLPYDIEDFYNNALRDGKAGYEKKT